MLLQNFSNLLQKHQFPICIKNCIHCSTILLKNGENIRNSMFLPFQKEEPKKRRKITVIGATGHTGVTQSYALYLQNYCDELVMFDMKRQKKPLCGHALDMIHGSCFRNTPKIKICMDMENTANSDVIVINAGIAQSSANQSRLDLCQDNIKIFAKFVPKLAKLSPKSCIITVSNPTEIMTYAVWKYSCFEKNRIMGAGTELDSCRFRYHLAQTLKVHPQAVTGYVIGEHGDSSVPVWSGVTVGGTKLQSIDPKLGTPKDKHGWFVHHDLTVKSGPTIVNIKGWTDFAIALTTSNIVRAILTNSRTVHCVSTQITGMYGITTECFLSLPCIIGNRGIKDVVQLELDDYELLNLQKSACILDKHLKSMKFP